MGGVESGLDGDERSVSTEAAASQRPVRAFVAIALPDGMRQSLHTLAKRLRAARVRVTWTAPERMHLTLRFLGEISPAAIDAIAAALRDAYAGREPFSLAVRGVGAFPSMQRPRVLWAGVEPAEGPVPALNETAEQAARDAGLPPEKQAFHPHITLGRIRDHARAGWMESALLSEKGFNGGEFTVKSVSLYASHLTPTGPQYQRLHEFPF